MKLNVKEVKLVWESEFSKLVSETYGRPYRLQQQESAYGLMGQDSIRQITVGEEHDPEWDGPNATTMAQWLARVPSDPMDLIERLEWERDFFPQFEVVVDDLYVKGLLEAGDYVIHAWW